MRFQVLVFDFALRVQLSGSAGLWPSVSPGARPGLTFRPGRFRVHGYQHKFKQRRNQTQAKASGDSA
eukprot:1447569-Rhodomonas_salina.1